MTEWVLAGAIGLVVGSFLNVVIARLPHMLEKKWREHLSSAANELGWVINPNDGQTSDSGAAVHNLCVPPSHCPKCKRSLARYDNVPILSYLVLRGRCRSCGASISLRYPAIEATSAAWSAWAAMQWGLSWSWVAWVVLGCALLVLAVIDWDTQLLPDELTLPLCWAGLLASGLGLIPVHLWSSVLGAVGGYLVLWAVYWSFLLVTGRQGMGYGDFKLLAALGAWLGWQNLTTLILLSSLLAVAHGTALRFGNPQMAWARFAFGPSLCLAGAVVVLLGQGHVAVLLR